MKHLIKFIVLILLIITIYLIYINTYNNQIDYMNLGDSYAKGINPYNNKSYGYSDYFKDYLIEKNSLNSYNNNFSTENETISSLLNQVKTNSNIKHIIRESDIITISIGLNDIIYALSKTPNPTNNQLDEVVYEIYLNFNDLIKEISKYTNNKIYVIGYNENIFLTDIAYSINKLNNYYSKNNEIIYIESPEELKNTQKYYPNPNNYHPNEQGYNRIYQEILKKHLINL